MDGEILHTGSLEPDTESTKVSVLLPKGNYSLFVINNGKVFRQLFEV